MSEPSREEMIEALRYAKREMVALLEAGADVLDILRGLNAAIRELETGGWRPIESAPKAPLVSHDRHRYGPRFIGGTGLACFICQWWETDIGGGGSNFLTDGGNVVHPAHWQPLPSPPTTSDGGEGNG